MLNNALEIWIFFQSFDEENTLVIIVKIAHDRFGEWLLLAVTAS